MAPPRGEIRDSDDEASDFSPVKGPIATDPPLDADTAGVAETTNSRDTESTDTSFFQRVYEEQRKVAALAQDSAAKAIARLSPEPSARETRQSRAQNSSSMTSITDPLPASRRTRKSTNREVIDLTQVTTPRTGAPSAKDEACGGPSSAAGQDTLDAAGSPLTVPKHDKNYSKRKRDSRSSHKRLDVFTEEDGTRGQTAVNDLPHCFPFPSNNAIDEDGSPLPARKKRKMAAKMSAGEENDGGDMIDVVGVHQGDDLNAWKEGESQSTGNPSGIVHDTLAGDSSALLVVAPSELTSSQKREYRIVNLSSPKVQDDQDRSLPGLLPPEPGNKSSGVTTIAYTTPSQFRSSRPSEPSEAVVQNATRSSRRQERNTAVDEIPPSSPDIIAATSTSKSRRSTGMPPGTQSSPHHDPFQEATLVRKSRATKKRKAGTSDPRNESWDSKEIRAHQPQYNRRPSRRRSPAVIDDNDELLNKGNNGTAAEVGGPSTDLHTKEPSNLAKDQHREDVSMISQIENSLSAEVKDPRPKKMRRKKKDVKSVELVEDEEPAEFVCFTTRIPPAQVTDAEQTDQGKRRGGRTRKSESAKLVDGFVDDTEGSRKKLVSTDEDEEGISHADPDALTSVDGSSGASKSGGRANGKDKKPDRKSKRGKVNASSVDESNEEPPGQKPLQEISLNAGTPVASSNADTTTTAKTATAEAKIENQVAGTLKLEGPKETVSKPGIAGKTTFRVGLSKRMRIAPLLKIIRK